MVRVLSCTFAELIALFAISPFAIVPFKISAEVRVLSCTFAELIAFGFIVTLFQVPQISPASCTFPALVVVAFGTVALEPIEIHAVPLHI